MEIKASEVKKLRDMTGAGMMDAKAALVEAQGNLDKAVDILREKGDAKSVKKGSRITAEGIVESYVHGGRIGVIVEVNSETDFVAKNDQFKQFARDVAMQVAAQNPLYVTREEVPAEVVEKEKAVQKQIALNEGNPNLPEDKAHMIAEKKVEGRMSKYFEEICLMDQAFIKDPSITLEQYRKNLVASIGENIVVRRFTRYEVGEGLEKREENFAEEVAKQMGK